MITFWNRKEVFAGFDIGGLARVRDTLLAAGIRYILRSVNHSASGARGYRSGNPLLSSMYYVYVHRDDLDRAQCELHKPRRY